MNPTRRDFIRYVGIALAGLVARSCGRVTCYTPAIEPPPTPAGTPTPVQTTCYVVMTPQVVTVAPIGNLHWAGIHRCWLSLNSPELQSYEETDFSRSLRERHKLELDMLVANNGVDASVAEQIQIAFEQAIAHVQRQVAECYEAMPMEYYPRQDLAQQMAALEEMAGKSDVDPATVAQAQEALERDIAWLDDFQAGRVPGALEEVEADPAAVEAARILVELLLGRME